MVISKVVLVKVVRGLLLVNHIVYRNKYIVNNNIVKGILDKISINKVNKVKKVCMYVCSKIRIIISNMVLSMVLMVVSKVKI